MTEPRKLLTTKQLPDITGLSKSFFDKGRLCGYGPKFIRIKSGRRTGRVFYRPEDVESWLTSKEQFPEGAANV
jgi:predicted DNA-binding transcriptional regulator AlpA